MASSGHDSNYKGYSIQHFDGGFVIMDYNQQGIGCCYLSKDDNWTKHLDGIKIFNTKKLLKEYIDEFLQNKSYS